MVFPKATLGVGCDNLHSPLGMIESTTGARRHGKEQAATLAVKSGGQDGQIPAA